MTDIVFRAAKHTRFMHSLGSYWATRALADRWIRDGSITTEEADALAVFALLHDVGHTAFSHTTEDFCLQDHHATTLELIRTQLKAPIEACGVDAGLVEAMASRIHPLYRAVCDKNIGTEKLDYLERDGLYTILSRPSGILYLRNYVFWADGRLVIDKKIVDHVLDTMTFYMKMYKGVYLRKSLVIAQRMFHKAIQYMIRSGDLSQALLADITDSELLGIMSASSDRTVGNMYIRLKERRLFKEGFVIRPQTFASETRVAGKAIHIKGVTADEMHRITASPSLQRNNHAALERLEKSIAKILKVPADGILLVPVFYPERFAVEDVNILGSGGHIDSLKEKRPAHFAGMEETARSYAALRICAAEEYRTVLSAERTAPDIEAIINSVL